MHFSLHLYLIKFSFKQKNTLLEVNNLNCFRSNESILSDLSFSLDKGEVLEIKAKSKAKFLVISGKPINEEIARGGPFVMNTKAEILQAVQDYHNGTFVK